MAPGLPRAAAAHAGSGRTLGNARRAWASAFRDRGIDTPELDARILLGKALTLDQAGLVANEDRRLTAGQESAIAALARRRLAREPVARILGCKEFFSLPFEISPATLVPRPETETVVEAALEAAGRMRARTRRLRIADLGTGCGAILLSLLDNLPQAFGVGSDISVAALKVARDNAARLRSARAHFVACDMAAGLRGPFDLVVSNPPYIRSADIAALDAEVRDFEPRRALDGGPDGLTFYRAIAAQAARLLRPGGTLVVELGAGQDQTVAAILAAAGLAPRPPRPDLMRMPRALVAEKS